MNLNIFVATVITLVSLGSFAQGSKADLATTLKSAIQNNAVYSLYKSELAKAFADMEFTVNCGDIEEVTVQESDFLAEAKDQCTTVVDNGSKEEVIITISVAYNPKKTGLTTTVLSINFTPLEEN